MLPCRRQALSRQNVSAERLQCRIVHSFRQAEVENLPRILCLSWPHYFKQQQGRQSLSLLATTATSTITATTTSTATTATTTTTTSTTAMTTTMSNLRLTKSGSRCLVSHLIALPMRRSYRETSSARVCMCVCACVRNHLSAFLGPVANRTKHAIIFSLVSSANMHQTD